MRFLLLLILLYWLVRGLDLIAGILLRMKSLKSFEALPPAKEFVSIIFAARNEGEKVREALRSLLTQNYSNYEVIAVSDRSTDNTLDILRSVEDEFKKAFSKVPLKVIEIESLPEGWLGKNHGLYRGYLQARGEFLLFTDADVWMHPETLGRTLSAVQREKLDHLTLFPELITRHFIENAFIHYFFIIFGFHYRPWAVSSKRSQTFVGVGAFNFIRRGAYEKAGTHQRLALDVADDVMLGKIIKRSGFSSCAMFGNELVKVRWLEGWRGILSALHKNAFRGFNYNLSYLGIASLGLIVTDLLPFILIFFAQGIAFGLCLGILMMIFLLYVSIQRTSPKAIVTFPAHPFVALLMLFILWRSALTAIRQKGILWRDTFYPLDQLKQGMV